MVDTSIAIMLFFSGTFVIAAFIIRYFFYIQKECKEISHLIDITKFYCIGISVIFTILMLVIQFKLASKPNLSFYYSLILFYTLACMDIITFKVDKITNYLFLIMCIYTFYFSLESIDGTIFVALLPLAFFILKKTTDFIFKMESFGSGDILAISGGLTLVYTAFRDFQSIFIYLMISSLIGLIFCFVARVKQAPFISCMYLAFIIQSLWKILEN